MRVISEKKRIKYAWLMIITGIGVGALTYNGRSEFSQLVVYYCIFNSLLTFFSGIFLFYGRIRLVQCLSILLGFSVTAALFLPIKPDDPISILNNVFYQLTYMGAVVGSMIPPWCGFWAVPLFLWNAYYGLYRGISYFKGNTKYNFKE